MPAPTPDKCPVCNASFRGSAICTRCRNDLTPLMQISAAAHLARRRAQSALLDGDLLLALRWSAEARRLRMDP